MDNAKKLLTEVRSALAKVDQEARALELAQEVIDRYPDSPEASSARKIITHIKPHAEDPPASDSSQIQPAAPVQPTVHVTPIPNGEAMLSTTDEIDGYRTIKNLGVVRGSTVRSRHVGSELGASLKSIVGGELKGVTKLVADAREQALARMIDDAKSLGANGVKGVRFSTSQVWESAAEVMAYGTAVLVEPIGGQRNGPGT